MSPAELQRACIRSRIRNKKPEALKQLEKAVADVVKEFGGDSLTVEMLDVHGEQLTQARAFTVLERGGSVKLRQWRTVRASTDILDPGEYEITGEIVIRKSF
jgi:hypothetical protein